VNAASNTPANCGIPKAATAAAAATLCMTALCFP